MTYTQDLDNVFLNLEERINSSKKERELTPEIRCGDIRIGSSVNEGFFQKFFTVIYKIKNPEKEFKILLDKKSKYDVKHISILINLENKISEKDFTTMTQELYPIVHDYSFGSSIKKYGFLKGVFAYCAVAIVLKFPAKIFIPSLQLTSYCVQESEESQEFGLRLFTVNNNNDKYLNFNGSINYKRTLQEFEKVTQYLDKKLN